MKYLSVCSGIEAASAAWMPLGWKPVAFSEIEPFPCSVLAHHHPDVPNWGDMTRFEEWPDESIDLLCGGTPCQSFSVAGLRKGLADPRGNLMLTFGAIAAKYRPRWLVWENVPGVLSSNGGRDFGSFLGLLGELGYGFAYRVLDAQYVRVESHPRAVPQRRRRVFVVGHSGGLWQRAAAVLFERESLRGHPAPRREAGQGVAACLTRGAESSGKGGYAGRRREDDVNLVAHALRGEGFDASEDGTGRGTPLAPVHIPEVAGTMKACKDSGGWSNSADHAAAGYMVPVGVTIHGTDPTVQKVASLDETAQCLRARTPGNIDNSSTTVVMQPVSFAIQAGALRTNPLSGPDGIGVQADHAYTLEARAEVQAVALALRGREGGATAELGDEVQNCLRASSGGGDKPHVLTAMQVRRMTPTEAERLQGFPDGYTAIPWRKKPASECPDGPRYKSLGNSWAVNCARWIGERIEAVETIVAEQAELEIA